MGNIANFIDKIKHAIYGKDVRDSIAKGIQQCYDDAIANGHTDMEVVQARKTYSNLNARLDAENGNVNNAIQTEKNNRTTADNNLQNQINSLASGSPLVANSVAGMTDTSRVYVNTTDGNWYYYNDGNWISGGIYQSTALESKSVTFTKLNKDITGSEYHITSNGNSYPRILFEFDMLQSVSKVRIKLKIKKETISPSSQIRLRLLRRFNPETGTENSYQEHTIVASSSELSKKYIEIDESFDLSTDFTQCNAIQIRVNNNSSSLITDWFVSDVQLWLNDIPIDLLYNKTDKYNTLTEDISEALSFLATKQYVNKIIEIFNETFDNKIAELDNVINIDSLTKSDLYNIVCWGDSLTAGGSAGKSYPAYLQELIGENVRVTNRGRGGECSGTIAWRQGGNIFIANEDFTIPATVEESVTFGFDFSSGYYNNFSNTNDNLACSIDGIEGRLDINVSSSPTAIFKRSTDGEEVLVKSGTQIVSTQAIHDDSLVIIWVGRNDMAFAYPHQINGVTSNIQAMIDKLTPTVKRFLIISCTTTINETAGSQSHNWVTSLNTQLKTLYPNNFVDIENYLVNQCIYDMELTPTEIDLEKISKGTIPPQLMADATHPNNATREYIAKYIYGELNKRGWIQK